MWVKVDDTIAMHPKLLAAGGPAAWHFICGLTYCARYLTDGRIPATAAPHLSAQRGGRRLTNRLVAAGLWEPVDGGYLVHDFLDYQISRDEAVAIDARRSTPKNAPPAQTPRPSKPKPKTNGVANRVGSNHESCRETDTEIDSNRALSNHESCQESVSVNGDNSSDFEGRLAGARGVLDLDQDHGVNESARPPQPPHAAPVEMDAPASIGANALRAWPKPGERERAQLESHPLYDALCKVFGPPIDDDDREKLRADLAALAAQGATPEEIPLRAEQYHAVMPRDRDGRRALRTRRALVKHWPACAQPVTANDPYAAWGKAVNENRRRIHEQDEVGQQAVVGGDPFPSPDDDEIVYVAPQHAAPGQYAHPLVFGRRGKPGEIRMDLGRRWEFEEAAPGWRRLE